MHEHHHTESGCLIKYYNQHSQMLLPSPKTQQQQTCVYQWLYAKNQSHTKAHPELIDLVKNQTDRVKVEVNARCFPILASLAGL